jgi:hypothetical protein
MRNVYCGFNPASEAGLVAAGQRYKQETKTMSPNDRHNVVHVVRHDGGWAVKKPHAERASGLFENQAEAIDRAKVLAGRGQVIVHGLHGKIRKITPFD